MAIERLSDLGYCMIKKETTKGVPVTPNVAIPLYEESLVTDPHLDESDPIIGNKWARHKSYMGQQSFMGDLRLLAEPNTAGYTFDMLMTKGTTTGAGPYTHPFTFSTTTNPNSYTVDLLRGQIVYRFFGMESRQITLGFDTNKGVFTNSVTARGVFSAAAITNVAANVLTLDSTYNTNPTLGLVNGDLVRLFLAGGTTVDTTVSSMSGNTVTVASAGAAAAGDTLCLRAQTPTLTILDPIMWARSEYRFGTTAAAALSATQTPIEKGSGEWTLKHNLATDTGEPRSGSFGPATLARTEGDAEIKTTLFFDTPDQEKKMLNLTKTALVTRHFVTGATYELRVTFNNLKIGSKPNGLKNKEIIYDEITWIPEYDDADAQAAAVTIINNVATI